VCETVFYPKYKNYIVDHAHGEWRELRIETVFILTRKNFGFTYMVGGTAVIGQAGSIEFTRTSTAYNFFGGNTSFQV
jgi:hypothetical protein